MGGTEDDYRVDTSDVGLGRRAAVWLRVFGRLPDDSGAKLVEAGRLVRWWRRKVARVRGCDGLGEV